MKNRGRKIGWKMLFSTVWLGKENEKDRKPGRKFSLLSLHFFILPNWEEKLERKVLSQHFYTNTLSHLLSFMTWWPSHLPHLMTFAHKPSLSLLPLLILPSQYTNIQRSRFSSLSFFFFFFFFLNFLSTWPDVVNFINFCIWYGKFIYIMW